LLLRFFLGFFLFQIDHFVHSILIDFALVYLVGNRLLVRRLYYWAVKSYEKKSSGRKCGRLKIIVRAWKLFISVSIR
jgi:hypothetical protein